MCWAFDDFRFIIHRCERLSNKRKCEVTVACCVPSNVTHLITFRRVQSRQGPCSRCLSVSRRRQNSVTTPSPSCPTWLTPPAPPPPRPPTRATPSPTSTHSSPRTWSTRSPWTTLWVIQGPVWGQDVLQLILIGWHLLPSHPLHYSRWNFLSMFNKV